MCSLESLQKWDVGRDWTSDTQLQISLLFELYVHKRMEFHEQAQ